MWGAAYPKKVDTYKVDLLLPNGWWIQDTTVMLVGYSGEDVLIGMDIINTGDFAITHAGFTFQTPARADIDFV